MISALQTIAGTLSADAARFRVRATTAAGFYGFAIVVFLAAFGLACAAGSIALVEAYGTVPGLLIAALILALAGAVALLVNGIVQRRYQERAERAAMARQALISETASEGLRQTRNAVPSMLPAAAILAFTLTSMLLKDRR